MAADAAEAVAREAADLVEKSERMAADAAEAVAREAADLVEKSERMAADAAEAVAREVGDAGLQSQIDAEVTARQAADLVEKSERMAADADIQAQLDAEVTTRAAAVSALDVRVTALEAVSFYTMKFTLTAAQVAAGGFIDLDHVAKSDSIVASVDRLMMHAGEDFTISTAGGKTRLTWAGPVAFGEDEALSAGNVVYVKYMA